MKQDILNKAMDQEKKPKTPKTYRIDPTVLTVLDSAMAYEIGQKGELITEYDFMDGFLRQAIKKIYPHLKDEV